MCWSADTGTARRAARVRRDEEGVLLLEALIGLAIIGIVAISLLAATGSHVRLADKADVLLTQAALAQDRLAALQLLNHEGFEDPPDSLLAGIFPSPFDEYRWHAEVTEAEGEQDLYAVRVVVEGRGETLPFETLVHRPSVTVVITGGATVSRTLAAGQMARQGRGQRGGGMGGREMMGLGGMRGGGGRGGGSRGGAGRGGQQGTRPPPPGRTVSGRPPVTIPPSGSPLPSPSEGPSGGRP